MGLDIPALLAAYNELYFSLSPAVRGRIELLPEGKHPSARRPSLFFRKQTGAMVLF